MPLKDEPPPELMRLYLERRAELVRFFTARTGSGSEAEDLVQELFFKVRQAAAAGEDVLNGAAYLYRLGLNLMLDRRRSAFRGQRRDRDYHSANQAMAGGEQVSEAPSAEDTVDARQRLARLLHAVDLLPPQCRRVFLLHKIEGLSHTEVAQKLGVSRSAVEKHMINALRRLAEALDPPAA